ncbi:unnamed protein product [Caretta caretta]
MGLRPDIGKRRNIVRVVDHGYLLGTLRAFSFGPQFMGFLQVLNWTLTEPVSFGWGVRQGCLLSGQLYVLVIKPFLHLLCRRLMRLMLRELELRLVLLAYADDVLLVVQDPDDLVRVEACQTVYSVASSAQVNWVKSSGLVVGDGWQPEVLGVAEAVPGRLLHLRVHMEGLVVNLINVYAPTLGLEQLRFYQQASTFLGSLDLRECLVLGGDFNATLKERDCSGTEQSPAAVDVLREIVQHHCERQTIPTPQLQEVPDQIQVIIYSLAQDGVGLSGWTTSSSMDPSRSEMAFATTL